MEEMHFTQRSRRLVTQRNAKANQFFAMHVGAPEVQGIKAAKSGNFRVVR